MTGLKPIEPNIVLLSQRHSKSNYWNNTGGNGDRDHNEKHLQRHHQDKPLKKDNRASGNDGCDEMTKLEKSFLKFEKRPRRGVRPRKAWANQAAANELYLRKIGKSNNAAPFRDVMQLMNGRWSDSNGWGREPTLHQAFVGHESPQRQWAEPDLDAEPHHHGAARLEPRLLLMDTPVALWLFVVGACLVVLSHIIYILMAAFPEGDPSVKTNMSASTNIAVSDAVSSLLGNINFY